MFVKCVVFKTLCFFCSVACLGDDAIMLAKERATNFSLQADYELEEYLMTAEISVESLPDSDIIFNARPSMHILHTKNFRVEGLTCRPTIISDDRQKSPNGGYIDAGPFTKVEIWERFLVGDKSYDLLDDYGLVDKPILIENQSINELRRISGTACLKPFEWVLHGPNSFEAQHSARDLHSIIFGTDRMCVFAKQENSKLESHWLLPTQANRAIWSVTFEEDLPVCNTLYYFNEAIPLNTYSLDDGYVLLRTETKWGKVRDTDVPETIVSRFKANGRDVLLIAKIKVSIPGDKAFEEKKNNMVKLANSFDLLMAAKEK